MTPTGTSTAIEVIAIAMELSMGAHYLRQGVPVVHDAAILGTLVFNWWTSNLWAQLMLSKQNESFHQIQVDISIQQMQQF